MKNLMKKIYQVGDVMFDSVKFFKKKIKKPKRIKIDKYVLLTLHRAENVDEKSRLELLIKSF